MLAINLSMPVYSLLLRFYKMRRTLVGFASENELILHQTPPGFVMYDSQKMRRTLVGFWWMLIHKNAPDPGGVCIRK
jgi:hypothetical protein